MIGRLRAWSTTQYVQPAIHLVPHHRTAADAPAHAVDARGDQLQPPDAGYWSRSRPGDRHRFGPSRPHQLLLTAGDGTFTYRGGGRSAMCLVALLDAGARRVGHGFGHVQPGRGPEVMKPL